jgi:putative aldouronate transport system permease protein
VIITVSGTVLGLLFMCPCAYALSRKEFKHKKALMVYLLIPMLFSGGLVSTYMVNTQILHLKNTYLALILPSMCSTWYLMILRNYFRTSVPDSLIEAGKMEGVSPIQSLSFIVIPICKPVVMTVAVFQIFAYWNSWYPALIYIDSNHRELYPLQYVLVNIERTIKAMTRDAANLSGMNNVTLPSTAMRMALVVVTILPIMVLFPFFQRFLKTGMAIGAVKE